MNEDGIGKGKIGLSTFITSPVPHNKCGSDGLPVTPNSIKVLGRAQYLKSLKHKHLCKYLDFRRGKHDRIFCISEFHDDNVLNLIPKQRSAILNEWYRVVTRTVYEIVDGLAFLELHDIIHHNLHPANVLINSEGSVRLHNYGLYHMTDSGKEVSFSVGSLSYLSPEECLFIGGNHEHNQHFPSSKVDTWALGMICLELCLGQQIFKGEELNGTCEKLLNLLISEDDAVSQLVKCCDVEKAEYIYEKLPDGIKMFIKNCLTVNPTKRPTSIELLACDLFSDLREINKVEYGERSTLFSTGCDCSGLRLPTSKDYATSRNIEPLLEREYSEIWHLWKLAGGDVFTEVRKSDTVHSVPPILDLPLSMSLRGEVLSLESSIAHLYDSFTITLSLEALRNRLKDVTPESYYPLLESGEYGKETIESKSNSLMKDPTSSLPLVIKENDIEYQLHRIILYKRLLLGYPYLRDKIWKEARIDIPPHLRGLVWAALLDVTGDVKAEYMNIDKETPIGSDRQIAVDIPRCHQYDPLLSSPTAHNKFRRVLKAWLKSHPHLSYWQGLDSLCAAFLHLNFNTEHLAWASMSNYIDKYLFNFFLKDNSAIIQEYLVVFRHLIAFHEPELANHLDVIGFIPELYSIPWFLTMFTHVFPLHKIVHLWDTLLLGNSSFPLSVGVAILKQLKSQLLTFDFNECILMFSDLPEIDIDAVVQTSIQLFCATPRSATYRKHAKGSIKSSRTPVSYYTEDYNTIAHDELSMSEVSLEDLKCEISPRISADDMIQLCELRGPSDSKTPAKRTNKNAKPKICIIDVRSSDEFHRAAIPGSYNIPYQSSTASDSPLVNSTAMQAIDQFKPRLIIVVGNKQGREDSKFAGQLVDAGYRGVLVLHRGIDVLRTTGLLTIQ